MYFLQLSTRYELTGNNFVFLVLNYRPSIMLPLDVYSEHTDPSHIAYRLHPKSGV